MRNLRRRQGGFTMIEVIIATVILSAIIAMGSWLVWSSSTTVSESELGIQLDSQARLAMNQIANDVRQCKALYIRDISSGTAVIPAVGSGFTAIQLRLPSSAYDSSSLNSTQGAATTGTWLTNYKANSDNYLTRLVQYSWAVDSGEGELLSPTSYIDDNKDGRVDEGVLKKVEWVTDSAGNLLTQPPPAASPLHSTICRDLRPWNIPTPILSPSVPASTPATQVSPCNWGLQFFVTQWPPTTLTITLTLEKVDPKYSSTNVRHTIIKQVQTTVDIRN